MSSNSGRSYGTNRLLLSSNSLKESIDYLPFVCIWEPHPTRHKRRIEAWLLWQTWILFEARRHSSFATNKQGIQITSGYRSKGNFFGFVVVNLHKIWGWPQVKFSHSVASLNLEDMICLCPWTDDCVNVLSRRQSIGDLNAEYFHRGDADWFLVIGEELFWLVSGKTNQLYTWFVRSSWAIFSISVWCIIVSKALLKSRHRTMTYSLMASILVITCSRWIKAATVDPVGRNAYVLVTKIQGQWSVFKRGVEKAPGNSAFHNTSEWQLVFWKSACSLSVELVVKLWELEGCKLVSTGTTEVATDMLKRHAIGLLKLTLQLSWTRRRKKI